MLKENKVIYESRLWSWNDIIFFSLTFMKIIGVLLVSWILLINYLMVIGAVILIFVFYFLVLKKQYIKYKILADRIEYFPDFNNKQFETIPLDAIFQVRFEDEFNSKYDFFSFGSVDRIILYINSDIDSSLVKDNSITIPVNDRYDRVNTLIQILKHFQSKDKEMFVVTKKTKILDELGIKNWNHS